MSNSDANRIRYEETIADKSLEKNYMTKLYDNSFRHDQLQFTNARFTQYYISVNA